VTSEEQVFEEIRTAILKMPQMDQINISILVGVLRESIEKYEVTARWAIAFIGAALAAGKPLFIRPRE
jgi:hypothetical protein